VGGGQGRSETKRRGGLAPEALPHKHWHRGVWGGGATPGKGPRGTSRRCPRVREGPGPVRGAPPGRGCRPRALGVWRFVNRVNGKTVLEENSGMGRGSWASGGGSTHRNNLPRLGGQTPDVGALWGRQPGIGGAAAGGLVGVSAELSGAEAASGLGARRRPTATVRGSLARSAATVGGGSCRGGGSPVMAKEIRSEPNKTRELYVPPKIVTRKIGSDTDPCKLQGS